jgi:hypothetical protein
MKQPVVGTKLCVSPTSPACGYKENKLIMYVTITKTIPETVSYKVLPLRNNVYSLGSTVHPVAHNHAIASAHLLRIRSCMAQRQAVFIARFPCCGHLSLHKNNKIKLPTLRRLDMPALYMQALSVPLKCVGIHPKKHFWASSKMCLRVFSRNCYSVWRFLL